MVAGDAGREQARRRFGATATERAGWPTEWQLEDLLDRPGARGAAEAAARAGNASARRALDQLASGVAGLTAEARQQSVGED